MQERWIGKNVDLALLNKYIEQFLKKQGFKTRMDERSNKECKILALSPSQGANHARGSIEVVILGNPNDFTIDLIASEGMFSSMKFGLLTTMFGGGNILLRNMRSREILDKLEKEFWVYAEETVGNLVDSAERI